MKTKTDSKTISDEVTAEMEIDVDVCEELDTRVRIDGEWWVSGSQRHEFCAKLGALIDEYRI